MIKKIGKGISFDTETLDKVNELANKVNSNPSEIVNAILHKHFNEKDKSVNFIIEKRKFNLEKLELNKKYNVISRREYMIDRIIEQINKFEKPKIKTFNTKNLDDILILSDLHLDGNNNLDLDKFVSIFKENKIKNIVMLGDNLNGILRISDFLSNKYNVGEQLAQLRDVFIKHVPADTNIYILGGNHGELTTTRDKWGIVDNLEHLFYQFIKPFYKNIVYHSDTIVIDNFMFIHGDKDTRKNSYIHITDPKIDFVVRGHFHKLEHEKINNIEFLTVPCATSKNNSYNRKHGFFSSGKITILNKNKTFKII